MAIWIVPPKIEIKQKQKNCPDDFQGNFYNIILFANLNHLIKIY